MEYEISPLLFLLLVSSFKVLFFSYSGKATDRKAPVSSIQCCQPHGETFSAELEEWQTPAVSQGTLFLYVIYIFWKHFLTQAGKVCVLKSG